MTSYSTTITRQERGIGADENRGASWEERRQADHSSRTSNIACTHHPGSLVWRNAKVHLRSSSSRSLLLREATRCPPMHIAPSLCNISMTTPAASVGPDERVMLLVPPKPILPRP